MNRVQRAIDSDAKLLGLGWVDGAEMLSERLLGEGEGGPRAMWNSKGAVGSG